MKVLLRITLVLRLLLAPYPSQAQSVVKTPRIGILTPRLWPELPDRGLPLCLVSHHNLLALLLDFIGVVNTALAAVRLPHLQRSAVLLPRQGYTAAPPVQ